MGNELTVGDVDDMPLEDLFSYNEIRERREQMRKSIAKMVKKRWKARYGDEF